MSAQIDVLAVMEDSARTLWINGDWPVDEQAEELGRAIKAVSELIESSSDYVAELEEFLAERNSGLIHGEKSERFRAALTRVKGA
jgi:hypothetical protein